MSFAMLSNDMVSARTYRHGLTFDSSDFRIAKEVFDFSLEVKAIIPLLSFIFLVVNEKTYVHSIKTVKKYEFSLAIFVLKRRFLPNFVFFIRFKAKTLMTLVGLIHYRYKLDVLDYLIKKSVGLP